MHLVDRDRHSSFDVGIMLEAFLFFRGCRAGFEVEHPVQFSAEILRDRQSHFMEDLRSARRFFCSNAWRCSHPYKDLSTTSSFSSHRIKQLDHHKSPLATKAWHHPKRPPRRSRRRKTTPSLCLALSQWLSSIND